MVLQQQSQMQSIHRYLQSFVFINDFVREKIIFRLLEATRASILNLNYPSLPAGATVLGGYKKTVDAPSMSDDEIAGKQHNGADDSDNRNAATSVSFWMPMIIFLTGLGMKFSF